jgi:hypothetical protein
MRLPTEPLFIIWSTQSKVGVKVKRFLKEVHATTWTIAGTGLVLITLTGSTRALGLLISTIAVVIHFVGLLGKEDK